MLTERARARKIERKTFIVLTYFVAARSRASTPTIHLVPSPMGRPSNREECSLRFETPDNTGNEQRGVLGSALLEEEYVLRCLNARAITEAA